MRHYQSALLLALGLVVGARAGAADVADVADAVRDALTQAGVSEEDRETISGSLAPDKVQEMTESFLAELKERLFTRAHDRLRVRLPRHLRMKMREELSAIRKRANAEGQLKASELNRVHLAIMKRVRPALVGLLRERTGALAAEAVKDQKFVGAFIAREISQKLPSQYLAEFRDALEEAGIKRDESAWIVRAKATVKTLIDQCRLDLSGIVDEATGEVIAKDEVLASPQEERCLGAGVAGTLCEVASSSGLSPEQQKTILPWFLAKHIEAFRATYRGEVRGRLFDVAREKLQATMAEAMPKKMQSRVQAIRMGLRSGGQPGEVDRLRVKVAAQHEAHKVMMAILHDTADQLAEEAAADDRLIAELRADRVRKKLDADAAAAFDEALAKANVFGEESEYLAKAGAVVAAEVAAYDPETAGIVDPKTGSIVAGEELGVPGRDEALWKNIRKRLREVLDDSGLSDEDIGRMEVVMAVYSFEQERLNYCMEFRRRLFEAARTKLQATMPEKMGKSVQPKIKIIRERTDSGTPLSAVDRARVQRAVMEQTRSKVMWSLHDTADELALEAAKDEKLLAGRIASAFRAKLSESEATGLDKALEKAGISDGESRYLTEVKKRIAAAVESHEPDLTGIIDPETGEVVVGEED